MKSPKLLVQALAVAACTTLVFTGGTAAVANAIGSNPSRAVVASSSPITVDQCNGPAAFKTISYAVNGRHVSTLSDNVEQGSKITVDFGLADGCENTPVGVASYKAKSPHGDDQPFGWQTIYSYDDGKFSSNGDNQISVDVPNCYFQVDFYTGTVAQPGDLYSPSGRLVGTDVGGWKSCGDSTGSGSATTTVSHSTTSTAPMPSASSETTTSTSLLHETTTTVEGTSGTTTTMPGDTTVTAGGDATIPSSIPLGKGTTTPKIPAKVGSVGIAKCPDELSNQVTGYSVEINGVSHDDLSSVKPGDTVTVHFTVAQGCNEQLSFASYQATSLDNSPSGVLSQTLYDSSTGRFPAGTYAMSIKVPNCMFQVDFVEGPVISHFGPVGSGNYYAGRILDTALAGTMSCHSSSSTTSTSSSTTSTTIPSTTTTSNVGGNSATTSTLPHDTTTTADVGHLVATTTSMAAEVQGESISKGDGDTSTTSPATSVEAEDVSRQLAMTGIDLEPILVFGILLLGVGGFFISTARRFRHV